MKNSKFHFILNTGNKKHTPWGKFFSRCGFGELGELGAGGCVDLENRCESDWDWSPRLSASDLFLSFKSTHPQFPDALSPR